MNPSRPPADLAWLARQYVLGELPDDESARFEATLADDPAACEAVAEATRLVLTLQVALPQPMQPARTNHRLVAATALAAGVLVAVLAWRPAVFEPTESEHDGLVRAEVIKARQIEARQLVQQWRGGRTLVGPLMTSDEDDIELADSADAVPAWMLAAVSIEKSQAVGEPGQDDELIEDN
jgi:anti-sigma factor RsiW